MSAIIASFRYLSTHGAVALFFVLSAQHAERDSSNSPSSARPERIGSGGACRDQLPSQSVAIGAGENAGLFGQAEQDRAEPRFRPRGSGRTVSGPPGWVITYRCHGEGFKDLEGFIAEGGLQGLKRHWDAGEGLVKRTRGKPSSPDRIRAVLELKASGMSKAEVSRALGLPEATVRRYWLKELPG